jgi:2-desacetyl-2-hydroxyethyl bacteriochlorophyllide A dehydrogenase
MIALTILEPGKADIREVDRPACGPDDVLIRLRYVGFCGSDLSTWLGKNPMVSYPRIPGHEISGVIQERGKQVPKDLKDGDRVTVLPYTSCGNCSSCRKGRFNACRDNQTLGVQRDGAMQEYMVVPWRKVMKAEGLSDLELALVEPLTVGFHAVERARVKASDQVMVLGCGMIGAGAIAGALQRSASVIAVDVDENKLELAGKLGVKHLINSRNKALHSSLEKITGGHGPDVVVEAAGNPHTYRSAIEEVGFAGRVVCIGYAGSDVPLPTKFIVQKEMDIMGSRNAGPDDFQAVITYLNRGIFPVDRMITRILKPEEAADALKEWAADPGQVMKLLTEF